MASARSSSSKLPHCIKSLHLNTKEHRSCNLCFLPQMLTKISTLRFYKGPAHCLLVVKSLWKPPFTVPLPLVHLEAWATRGTSGSLQGQRCLCK